MVAQIDRTARMLDECCRPMKLLLVAMTDTRQAFVCEAVVELETIARNTVVAIRSAAIGFAFRRVCSYVLVSSSGIEEYARMLDSSHS